MLREVTRAGDRVAIEDPAFTGVIDLLAALSLVPVPVKVDDEGAIASSLRGALRSARAFIVTPRAQNPTGAAITKRRARELRRVLEEFEDVVVIEDDHAGPIAGARYVTLVTGRQQWAVVRSVSTTRLNQPSHVVPPAGVAATLSAITWAFCASISSFEDAPAAVGS